MEGVPIENKSPEPVESGSLDVDKCIERLKSGQILPEHVCKLVCVKLKEIFIEESNIQLLHAPVTVVGDVHGQFSDVLEMFQVGGEAPFTNYLFLGDYVDRGCQSVETISLLACLKLRYPQRVTLIRGNHESRAVSSVYGFYDEVKKKYGSATIWKVFNDLFDYMPIAALIDNIFLAVHGGLSPSIHSIEQLRVLYRFQEVPHEGPIADLLWSDPDTESTGFRLNTRGAGYTFGRAVVDQFNYLNGIDMIVRAHQLCNKGFQLLFDDQFATVWSAPNYCYRQNNLASILEIDENFRKHWNVYSEAPKNLRVLPDSMTDTGPEEKGDSAASAPSSSASPSAALNALKKKSGAMKFF